jgi:hypothetical protein
MKRFERIGFPREYIYLEARLKRWAEVPVNVPLHSSWAEYQSLASDCLLISLYAFLLDEVELSREWAKRSIGFVDQHFGGEWRGVLPTGNDRKGPPDKHYHGIHTPWDFAFRSGMLAGSLLERWSWLENLGGYLIDDICRCVDQTESNRAWYLLVAGVLRSRPWAEMTGFYEKTQNAPQKREKLLARLLHSIVEGTESDRSASTNEYFTHFKKSDRKQQDIEIMLPLDASFLVHYSRHLGRPLPVPADVTDYIVDLGAE